MPQFPLLAMDVGATIFLAIFWLSLLLGYFLLKIVPGLKRGDDWFTILANGSKPRTGSLWGDAFLLVLIIALVLIVCFGGAVWLFSIIPK